MADFRLAYLLEARECHRQRQKQSLYSLPFWANLIGALANGIIACVPDSVAAAFEAQQAWDREARNHLRDAVEDALDRAG
ncbi:hypothetical protein DQP57_00155 [Mycobacterium colombiense]|uniref:Uncharacterized protein n=1 Tax=Mycobacterium colombiense TaxID=339268 RepID=A0A329MC55_9MYCO|nr:hypothetical protein DQP57_00155 [Mycobacterium colombiense]